MYISLIVVIYLQESLRQPILIGLDSSQWVDSDSWEMIRMVSANPTINTLTIVTTYPYEDHTSHLPRGMRELLSDNVEKFELSGLSPTEMVQLASQKLDVTSLPQELEGIIQTRSLGSPLWCMELIDILLDLKYLEVKNTGEKDVNSKQVLSLIHKPAIERQPSRTMLSMVPSSTMISPATSSLAVKKPSLNLPIPESVTGIVLTRITNLSATEQMTLKCAAVAGVMFKKDLLTHIIPNCVPENLQRSIDYLIDNDLLECAVAARVMRGTEDTKNDPLSGLVDTQCMCLNQGSPLRDMKRSTSMRLLVCSDSNSECDMDSKPIVTVPSKQKSKCETLQFIHGYVRDTLYSLWTETQKKQLHKAAAKYFQELAHRCASCGGGPFISGGSNDDEALQVLTPESSDDDNLEEKAVVEFKHKVDVDAGAVKSTKSKTEDRLEKIFSSNMDRLSMTCYCSSVLNYVYPHLIEHWRYAGNVHCLVDALVDGGAAAVAMNQNMMAMSMLREAELLMHGYGIKLGRMKEGRIYSLIGQVRKSASLVLLVFVTSTFVMMYRCK